MGRHVASDRAIGSPITPARPRVPGGSRQRDAHGADSRTPLETPALRLSEVARRLALSRAAAYRLVLSGELPGIRIGTSWRVLQVDFDAYVDRMRAEADRRYRRVRG